jgi:molybdate transport system substrate-binding protein
MEYEFNVIALYLPTHVMTLQPYEHQTIMKQFGSILFLLIALVSSSWADTVQVAVAANFAGVLEKLSPTFSKSGHTLVISSGATGKLYSQIKNGAPFEVLLSADAATPQKLEAEGLAVPGTRFTYAIGKLVLWSAEEGFVDKKGLVLKKGRFDHVAIANPKTAPYGAAAIEVLGKLDLLSLLEPKFVQGENIAQTYEFIGSGNAALGFVALSQVQKDGKITGGSAWIIPENLYKPIVQDAVVLTQGKDKPGVVAFIEFMKSPEAQKVIKASGYTIH